MNLRAFRLSRGLTQHQLARRAGISVHTIWSVENGRPCRQDTKRRLLRALGVDWAERADVFRAAA